MRLENKIAIITGGANGIGRATVEIFLREGAAVVIADRDCKNGSALAETSTRALFVETDVSSDRSVADLVAKTVAHFGGVDALVNNAGVDITGSVVDTEPQRWQRVLDVNLSSIYRTCHEAIPHMITRGGGAIVNISSVQGMYGWPNYSAYATSKAGIFGFTRQAAFEYAEQNIRINAISPGAISTQLGQNSDTLEPDYAHDPGVVSAPQETATDTPVVAEKRPRLKQAGKPEDIAYAALFLASEEAAYISGQNLVVDGGLTTHVG
jgi:meso-butanediol dehydrogenase / (S,S)-butanediol dehydrogenase / diacetyl reductase